MTVGHRIRRVRRGTQLMRATLAGLLATILLSGGAGAAATEHAAPSTAGAFSSPADKAKLIIAPADPVLKEHADEYVFSAHISNPSTQTLPEGTLVLELGMKPVGEIAELSETFTDPVIRLTEVHVDNIDSMSSHTVKLSVPAHMITKDQKNKNAGATTTNPDAQETFNTLQTLDPGVYRVRAQFFPGTHQPPLEEATPSHTSHTPLTGLSTVIWKGIEADARVALSTIVPLVLPEQIPTLLTRGQLSNIIPEMSQLLHAATLSQATLAIDPRLIANIRAYGDSAPQTAKEFLNELEQSSLTSFLLQFADADPAAQAALGYEQLLTGAELDFVTRYGHFPERNRQNNQTHLKSANTAQPLPTLTELTAWPQQEQPTAWPAEGAVDDTVLDLLQRCNITHTIIESTNVTQHGGPLVTLDTGTALITDHSLGEAIHRAVNARSNTEQDAGFTDAATRLALAAKQKNTGLVLGLHRTIADNYHTTATTLTRLLALEFVQPVSASEQQPGTADLRPAETTEERRELLRSAASREASITKLASILVRPEYLIGYQRSRLLELFATRYATPGTDFAEVAERYRERDAELLQGVRVVATEHTQLVGASTQVPLQLRNSIPFDASVNVSVEPTSAGLSLSQRKFMSVLVPENGNERVLVPVSSRVSSGESGLVVGITDAKGQRTVFTGTLDISIHSSIELIALWSLGALTLLLLSLGIWRSVRAKTHRHEN